MATPLRRSLVVGLLVLACLAVVPAVPATPASADTPSVTIPPDDVSDADVVTLTTSGFASGVHGFVQCPTASIGSAVPGSLPTGCSIEFIGFGDVAPTFDMQVERELAFTGAGADRSWWTAQRRPGRAWSACSCPASSTVRPLRR